MTSVLWTLASFVIAISVLIAFHEWGHFIVARMLGIKVLRFSIGFGKVIYSKVGRKGTEYALSLVPLGGYVKMLDENEGPVAAEDLPYAFNRQSLTKRIAVVIAGPLFNFIFAIIAFWLMLVVGIDSTAPAINSIEAGSIAANSGFQPGDEFVSIANRNTASWRAVNMNLLRYTGSHDPITVVVQRDNQPTTLYLTLTDLKIDTKRPNLVKSLGLKPYRPPIPPVVDKVLPGEPASLAGFEDSDEIISVRGKAVTHWDDFVDVVKNSPNKPIEMQVRRRGEAEPLTLTVTPRAKEFQDETVGYMGVQAPLIDWPEEMQRIEKFSMLEAIIPAMNKTWDTTTLTLGILKKLVFGQLSPKTLSGPIGIAQGAGMSAAIGLSYFLSFLALISVSLAILNLLPIPLLDGGHLLYYAIEAVTRKPLSEKAQALGFRLGLILLVSLMMLAFYNDLIRILS